MPIRNPAGPTAPPARADVMRCRVLDAAERLLRNGRPAFSMRDLAAEAGVSFATPFNQFGSKTAIMHALSARRIDAMVTRFGETPPPGDAVDRVLLAVDIAAAVMLAEPQVNRAVMSSLGAPSPEPGQVYAQSRGLWALALAGGDGFEPGLGGIVRSVLPDQFAVAFRGVLSFWTAGEIPDAELAPRARAAATALMLGFVGADRRPAMLSGLESA